jgi:Clostripain family
MLDHSQVLPFLRISFPLLSIDTDLEGAIRNDLGEYLESSAIRDPSITSWIYFDSRNFGTESEDITDPIPDIFFDNGTTPEEKYEGSLYITYSHAKSRYIINTVLPGEQNSDLPETVLAFLTKAFTNCVSNGASEFLLLFSSHGAGFYGYGGDDNKERRRLIQTNPSLAGAIRDSLSAVEGAPSKLNVLAFDACLMSEFGAFDDYRALANYILASEEVEPGHGK